MPVPVDHDLAVIIPAYKVDFLARALESLLRQTDQRFSIYVFDDDSPADIKSVTQSVLGERLHYYKRFDSNLGSESIAKHWNRCIALTREPWVWVFSDDDVMDVRCVEAFHRFMENEDDVANVLRFDAWKIDENDKIIEPCPVNIDNETWLQFAYGCLVRWRTAFMQQVVFRRSALEEVGGFLDLPLGWGTDCAAVIATTREKPIRRIPGANVRWRRSRMNLSPDLSLNARKSKLRATCLFLHWLRGQLEAPREHLFEADDAAFFQAMDRFLTESVLMHGSLAALANWKLLSDTRARVCEGSRFSLTKYIAVAGLKDSMWSLGSAARMLAKKLAT